MSVNNTKPCRTDRIKYNLNKAAIDLNNVEKNLIYKQTRKEIKSHNLIKDFEEYDYKFFEKRALQDVKKIKELRDKTIDPNIKIDLQKVIDSENLFIDTKGMTDEEIRMQDKLLKQAVNLQFLIEKPDESSSDDSEYGEEVYNKLFADNRAILQDANENTCTKYLKDAGENDFIQAVF